MTRITGRFVLLIASAAIAPLVVYGAISVVNLRAGTGESVKTGNLRVAGQVAEQIGQYFDYNTRVLRSVGVELRSINLQPWQQSRILKDYAYDFPEFREITFFGSGGRMIATSRADESTLTAPEAANVGSNDVYIAPLRLDEDSLPQTTIAVRVQPTGEEPGWVVATLDLEELWRMVDRVRVGNQGFAMLVGEGPRLIAHGNPNKKDRVAKSSATAQQRSSRTDVRGGARRAPRHGDDDQLPGRQRRGDPRRRRRGSPTSPGSSSSSSRRARPWRWRAASRHSSSSPSASRCSAR